jgi:hypothetical protein
MPTKTAEERWIDTGPIRAWRHSRTPPIPLLTAAGRLGVGMSMMQMYERGIHKPRASKHATFAEVLGEDWSERWDEWLARRPTDV